jgi:biopolymer transport protein ExbD
MKRLSPLRHKRGRIEIIPLIDIMFFLLAAFMMVSIAKIKVNSLKVALPTEVPATEREPKEDFVSISVNPLGQVQIDKQSIGSKAELIQRLDELYAANHEQKLLIFADRETHHGDVMALLGRLRQAGFERVAFAIKADSAPPPDGGAGTAPAPGSDAGSAPGTPAAASEAPATDSSTSPAPAATDNSQPAGAAPAGH